MSETLLIWLFAGSYGLIGVLFIMQWQHSIRCKSVGEDIAVIKSLLLRIQQDIGTHETGLRGQLHELRSKVMPFILMQSLELESRQKERDE